jgi:T5orf172 domain
MKDPGPSDSVSWKILDPLEDRDFEKGSLYIFDRASSPGHVHIGWTARSVFNRLQDWSECGYTPNLLFSVHCVPHAQRAETLTRYELIKEWRRERKCKANWCQKSHQQWFEVSKERAEQVLGDWANFFIKSEPYDLEGWLKNQWREVIETMDRKEEVVTAKKLLEHYEAFEEAALVEEPIDVGHAPKIEETVGFGCGPEVGDLEAPEEILARMRSLLIEQPTLPKETPLLKSEALPKQIVPVEVSLPKAKKQPKSDLLF